MTIGALTVGAAGVAFSVAGADCTVATTGASTALVTRVMPVAVDIARAIGTVTGIVSAATVSVGTAVTGASATAATGSGIVSVLTLKLSRTNSSLCVGLNNFIM